MPIYEYECPDCKFYTEVIQKVADKPLTRCPSCGSRRFKRLISAPVFRLKGSGWYETDFKSDKENKRNLAGADQEAPADAKAEAQGEAKAEGVAESKPEAEPKRTTAATAASSASAPARSRPAHRGAVKTAARAGAKTHSRNKPVSRRKPPARKK